MSYKKFLKKWQLDILTIGSIAILAYFAGTPQGIEMAQNLHDTNVLAFYTIFVPMAGLTFTWGYKRLKERIK